MEREFNSKIQNFQKNSKISGSISHNLVGDQGSRRSPRVSQSHPGEVRQQETPEAPQALTQDNKKHYTTHDDDDDDDHDDDDFDLILI